MASRTGLPPGLRMRHSAHYVETLTARSDAVIGRMIAIEQLQPNPDQPRKDLGDLSGLIESVREKGVLEPLLVGRAPDSDNYQIISGERRLRAAQGAGLREVPCIELDTDEGESLRLALAGNLQRKDLTPFEEADGLASLSGHFEYTDEELAQKFGRGRSSIAEVQQLSLRVRELGRTQDKHRGLIQTLLEQQQIINERLNSLLDVERAQTDSDNAAKRHGTLYELRKAMLLLEKIELHELRIRSLDPVFLPERIREGLRESLGQVYQEVKTANMTSAQLEEISFLMKRDDLRLKEGEELLGRVRLLLENRNGKNR